MPDRHPPLLWDIFCQVIDNHGDLGVCWRLSRELAARGQRVRLWVDDARALAWMAPGALQGAVSGVAVLPWTVPIDAARLAALPPAQVLVEAFGCTVPPEFVAHRARAAGDALPPPVWINLEYLSAEPYVERMHALPSPVLQGAAAGWTKWFFYPGFTPRTGGLLREHDLAERQAAFDRCAWRAARGIDAHGPPLASLFCYEPEALGELLETQKNSQWLITAGRATALVRQLASERVGGGRPWPPMSFLPPLPQTGYDELLWACDLNFVRGEDSLVRALWAGQPFVWQIYPQHDDAHHGKLQALLDWLDAPSTLRQFHRRWNGISTEPLPAPEWPEWGACVQAARARFLAQDDLCSQLQGFVAEKR